MLETMYDAPGVGLAAIQVGVPQRMVTMDVSKSETERQPMVLINPEVVASSEELNVYEEGCLSIPEYYEEVERPARVTFRYTNLEGETVEQEADGLLATCIQHEIDHLNGVLFIDYLSKLKRDRVMTKFKKAAKRGQAEHEPPGRLHGDAGFRRADARGNRGPGPRRRGRLHAPPRRCRPGHGTAAIAGPPPRRPVRDSGLHPHDPANRAGRETFSDHEADVAVVVAYGMILPQAILDAPELGCFNLHASLLPRWRGAAPIQRAIMAGDVETGIAVMKMEEGLDTGPVAMSERFAITPEMTAGELHDEMMVFGADLMVRALAALSRGGLGFTPQPEEGVTYAHKIRNEDSRDRLVPLLRPCTITCVACRPFRRLLSGRFRQGHRTGQSLTHTGRGRRGRTRHTARRQGLVACGGAGCDCCRSSARAKGRVTGAEFLRGVRLGPGAALA